MDSFTLNKIEFDAVRRILAQFAHTSLGKSLAMRITPSKSPEVINRWLEQTTQMVRVARDIGLPPFGGITDITEPLQRAVVGGGAGGADFIAIASTLEGAGSVRAFLSGLPSDVEVLHAMAAGIGGFDGEIKAIRLVVGDDGTVRDNASPRLHSLRMEIAHTTEKIREVIYGFLRSPEVVKLLQNVAVTLHEDRYVLPVRVENRGRLPGVVHRSSQSGATAFVEPAQCVELNNHLSDLCMQERHEVTRLLDELSVRVHARSQEMISTLHALAQVDLLSAKAQYAYQFDMTCPEMMEGSHVHLHQARHPLLIHQAYSQEKLGVAPEKRHPVVPIDVRLGQDFDLLIITGSNTGGKTVALKTTALLAVMAQSGMHIPAQRGATLSVFSNIFIDIGDEQSLQQSLSTFGAHIKRVRFIFSHADKASLVLLDELGSGTDPDEGGAIGQAILDELRKLGCLGMVTTHLSVLKAYAYNHERVDNASVDFDTATMTPTYHLRIGTPGESHAIAVAQRLGLPKQIVAAARQHLGSQGRHFRAAIKATSAVRQSAEEARKQALEAEVAAQRKQETLESKISDVQRLREEFTTWLASLPDLKAGDEVFVPSLGRNCTLVRLELHRQIALVSREGMHIEVPLSELIPDLGQAGVREQAAGLRRKIIEESRRSEQLRMEAEKLQQEGRRAAQLQKQRAQQFDTWLNAIARVKVGDEIPIAHKPGRGKVLQVDFPGLKVKILAGGEAIDLSLQDLFPQAGPFAHHEPHRRGRPNPHAHRDGHREHAEEEPNRPIQHRDANSRAAKNSRQAILAAKPGSSVFVVPFNTRAMLVRVLPEKDHAVVQRGAFEMEVPLADLELINSDAKPSSPHKGK